MGERFERPMRSIAVALGLLVGPACGGSSFACSEDLQCSPKGTCETSGFCSFPDSSCATGRRYGDHASSLSGSCVPESDIAAGTGTSTPHGSDSSLDGDGSGYVTSDDDAATSTAATSSTPTSTSGEAESESSESSELEPLDDPIVLYTFAEGEGTAILDRSGLDPPIDLQLTSDGFTWVDDGLQSNGSGIAISSVATTRVVEACAASNEFAVEAWITPAVLDAAGPARIVSMSYDYNARNFTLGQEQQNYVIRLRTTQVDGNGQPQSNFAGVELALVHVVYTRDSTGAETFYLDGAEAGSGTRDGELTNWSDDFAIMLGNEDGTDRPWPGVFHRVALYDRALSADRVQAHYQAGPGP